MITLALGNLPERLQRPPSEPAKLPNVGDMFGPYLIQEVIGSGGMGVVFRAAQLEPVRRTVALKLMRADFRDELAYAMFLVERQALAGFDHPYIAHVLDAGMAVTGGLYFAMEWIDGVPIDSFCESRQLSLRAIVELLIAICHGVEHAHARGVIHRDLKPNNILVQMVDGRPTPRIIDFGIAAAPGNGDSPATGTPGYMSPEQQAGGGTDARTDVYSLGVILCALLAAQADIDLERWWIAPADDRQRWLVASGGDVGSPLRRCIPVDLAAIIARAIDPVADGRYVRAGALADDLRAFLAGNPVQARPHTTWYVLQRFIARHRYWMAASSATVLTIIALGLYAWAGWRHADEQRQQTDRTAAFLQSVLASVDPDNAREHDKTLMKLVLDDAADRFDQELAATPRAHAEIAVTIAATYISLGEAKRSLAVAVAARADAELHFGPDSPQVERLDSVRLSALRMDGQIDAAHQLALNLLERERRLYGESAEETLQTISTLVRSYADQGKLAEARALGEATLVEARRGTTNPIAVAALQSELAQVLSKLGLLDEALQMLNASIAVFNATYGVDDLRSIEARVEVGGVLFQAKRYAEALRLYEAVVPQYVRIFGPEHTKTLTMRGNVAAALMTIQPSAAADMLTDILAIRRRVLGEMHQDTILTLGNQAASLWWAKRYAEAAPAFHEYVVLCDQIRPANHPSCAERRKGEGKSLRELGRYPEAEVALLDAYARKTKAEGAQFGGPAEVAGELVELYRRWDKPEQMRQWQQKVEGAAKSESAH